jgi:hypothetical protein
MPVLASTKGVATKHAALASGKYVYRHKPTKKGSWRMYVSYGGNATESVVCTSAKTVRIAFKVN